MTVTLTYDDTLSRVRITATGLAAADLATVERSTDGIRWTTVRGGEDVAVTAGSLAQPVDDYEFPSSVLITYRVRGRSTAAITFVGAGAGTSAAQGSLTPAFPGSMVKGDLILILASTRNSGTGTVNTPAGYSVVKTSGNVTILGKVYDGSESAPTITFTGGATNEDTLARIAVFRNAALTPLTTNASLNSSAQNIAFPAVTVSEDGCLAIVAGWKQDDWTSVATLAGMTEIGETSSTAGSDAAQVWDYVIQTTAANISAGSFVVTGGASAISRGLVAILPHAAYLNEQTNTITATLTAVWLKSIPFPFLNRTVAPIDWSPPLRPARRGVFPVIGAKAPIAVSDVRGSQQFDLTIRITSLEDSAEFSTAMDSGDTWFIHTYPGCPVPSGYVSIGDVVESRPTPNSTKRYWLLPCTIARAPDAAVVGTTATWQTILNNYATWADLLADQATWADVLALVGSVDDVVVG